VLSDASAPDIHTFPDNTEKEFRAEVKQSLDRAFAEGHSIDNAAVELKTLRLASNVSLTCVREAVISAIVERIPLVDSGAIQQRKEIMSVISRWGVLIDKIGGVDAVETVSLLQVSENLTHGSCVWGIVRYGIQDNKIVLCSHFSGTLRSFLTHAAVRTNIGCTLSG
jgi:hypothetical protein